MVPLIPKPTRNSELIASFSKYCYAHPEERFWQALRNWSGWSFVAMGTAYDEISGRQLLKDIRAALERAGFPGDGRNGGLAQQPEAAAHLAECRCLSCMTGLSPREAVSRTQQFPAPQQPEASLAGLSAHIDDVNETTVEYGGISRKPQAVGLREALGEIALWLDDNLSNEEGAPFERRAELMEKAFQKVIALATPAPARMSANEMLEQVKCSLREWPNGACDREIGELVDQIVARSAPATAEKQMVAVCELCKHSLENNSHGFDQNDGWMDGDKLVHSGHCTYCKICQNPALERSGLPGGGE